MAYLFHHNHDSKVVYYHDIGKRYTDMGTDFGLFKKHISIIKKSGYEIVPSINQKEKQIMICFDDGWAGIYDYKDFLIANNIVPTIFIAVELIGKDGYLSISQIKEMINLGFQFESHTWTHKDLTTFSNEGLEHEIKDSKNKLENLFDIYISSICYPLGRFSYKIKVMCTSAGYKKQFTSIEGSYFDLEEEGLICRKCAQFATPFMFFLMLNSNSSIFKKKYINQQVEG